MPETFLDRLATVLPLFRNLSTKERALIVGELPDLQVAMTSNDGGPTIDVEAFAHRLSAVVPRYPHLALQAAVPQLVNIGANPLPTHLFSIRLTNALRGEASTWSDIMVRSYNDCLLIKGLGGRSARELWAVAILEGLRSEFVSSTSSSGRENHSPGGADETKSPVALHDPISAWATGYLGASSSLQWLLARLDDRDIHILARRVACVGRRETLRTLGSELNITRERVRQLETHVVRKLQAYKIVPEARPLLRRGEALRKTIGSAIPVESPLLVSALQNATADLDRSALSEAQAGGLLLYLAGPYKSSSGWLLDTSESATLERATASLKKRAKRHAVPIDVAREMVIETKLKLVDEHAIEWIAHTAGLKLFRNVFVPRAASVVYLCELVLAETGEPMGIDDLIDSVPQTYGRRSVRNRLLSNRRFVRTGKSSIGLRSWSVEEYTSIADEISERIEAHGGQADVDLLVREVTSMFQVSINSVKAFITAPRFVLDRRRSLVRLRRPDEPYDVGGEIAATTRCYREHNGWQYRVKVDENLLRGSGFHIPGPFGTLGGARPGRRFHVKGPTGPILVSWPDSSTAGPSLGSLRREIASGGGSVGDWLFLALSEDKGLTCRLLRADSLTTVNNLEKIGLLVGLAQVPSSESDLLSLITGALDIGSHDGGDPIPRIRATLIARGEEELASLLARGDESESEALKRLTDSLC